MNYFGTDGIRGLNEIFTYSLLERVSFAAASTAKKKLIIIGRDTRSTGVFIKDALVKYLTKFGVDVIDAGMTPTPTLAYLTRAYQAHFGIMISASHNPPEYNGIKFFASCGGKLSEAEEAMLEKYVESDVIYPECNAGTLLEIDGDEEYICHFITALNPQIQGIRVLLDTSNGAMSSIAPKLFKRLKAKVTVINNKTDGIYINHKCGATCIDTLKNKMNDNYDIGFSYDGDGDRLIAVKNGLVLDGDHIIYVVARYLDKLGQLNNKTLVGTVMTNLGVEAAIKEKGFSLLRTKVGDKYVFDAMVENNCLIGGEASGHLIFYKYQNTGDGLLASILLSMIDKEYGLDKLDDIKEYPQFQADIKTTKEKVEKFKNSLEIKSFLTKVESEINGRIVVRASGTEPKIRIMTEAKEGIEAQDFANKIKEFILRSVENE